MSTIDKVQQPKVVVIGAGSLFFGRQAIWQMVHSPHLNTGTLALVDTDAERLDKLATLAKLVIQETGVGLQIEAANDWKDVLPGADFVVQVDNFVSGRTAISSYMQTFGPDHATDIIENMVGNLGKPFYINTLNQGAITNMADDAFLELLCDIDMNGPRPSPVGEMPRGIRAMQEIILDTHELTAETVAKCDHTLLRRAMLTDPLVNSIVDADALIQELLELERDALPACWFA